MLIEVDLPKRIFHAPDGYRRLTINLPEDLHKKLKVVAALKECTATEIIEQCLRETLR
jgi:Tat protein secretion system quality control protein TatD with DNase activity